MEERIYATILTVCEAVKLQQGVKREHKRLIKAGPVEWTFK